LEKTALQKIPGLTFAIWTREELDKFANTKVLVEPVNFTGDITAVTVRTSDIGDGYVRVQISTHFQGQSSDKVSPQPATVWPLTSKGVMEQNLVKTLKSDYKPLQ
jgi:hypothetical protein